MTQIIAKQAFFYGTRTRQRGDVFHADPGHAHMLIATGKADLFEEDPTVTKPRRQYRRRDMKAEA